MAHSHEIAIKAKMTELANVTTQAEQRINTQILSMASRELLDYLGDDDYAQYIADFDAYSEEDYAIFNAMPFDELTSAGKLLRNLIFGEAYFGLYYLALALKKLVKGAVNVSRESAGSANIYASAFDEIITNADNYKEQALVCLAFATGSSDDDSELYSEGSMGVFVV